MSEHFWCGPSRNTVSLSISCFCSCHYALFKRSKNWLMKKINQSIDWSIFDWIHHCHQMNGSRCTYRPWHINVRLSIASTRTARLEWRNDRWSWHWKCQIVQNENDYHDIPLQQICLFISGILLSQLTAWIVTKLIIERKNYFSHQTVTQYFKQYSM